MNPVGPVTVRLATAGDSAVLTVEDNGIGIPLDKLPLLFQRFHRARNAAAYRRSGLGNAAVNNFYLVRSLNPAGQTSPSIFKWAGEMDFTLIAPASGT